MEDWDARLGEWAAGQRAGEAAAARAQERWLLQRHAETTDLATVVRRLCHRRLSVAISLRGGSAIRGMAQSAGADFLTVDGPTLVPFAAIVAIAYRDSADTEAAGPVLTDHDDDHTDDAPTFAAVLARLAEDRPDVRVLLDGEHTVIGELRQTGEDVARITDSYVAIDAIAALTLV